MNARQINGKLREKGILFARGQFRAYRVYAARVRKGRKELNLGFGVVDGRVYRAWVPVHGFGMVVEARDGSIL